MRTSLAQDLVLGHQAFIQLDDSYLLKICLAHQLNFEHREFIEYNDNGSQD